MSTFPIIHVKNIYKSFHVGNQDVPVLKDITFDVNLSDFLIIFGPSGCGKSVLLHTILGLEKPTKGQTLFWGADLYDEGINEDFVADLRKKHIGMIYQQPNWIKSLSVLNNVAFPLLLLGTPREVSAQKALQILKELGMSEWANYSPMELSSGQQQMIALARALITNPEVIVADEPTGNLDYETGQRLMNYLNNLNQNSNKTIIMVTHDLDYLRFANVAIRMLNGEIKELHRGSITEEYIDRFHIKHGS